MRGSLLATLCVSLVLPVAAAGQNDPAFFGLGDLPGGAVGSVATAVSKDAGTVVGHAEGSGGTEAVRWTAAGGLQGLGASPSRASGVSDDGSRIAGTGTNSSSAGRAIRWNTSGAATFLDVFACTLCAGAATGEGISGNGLVVVGSGLEVPLFGSPHVNAARWAGGGTGIGDLGDLPGGGEAGMAHGATTTGSIIVGEADASAGPSGFWRDGSMHALPGLPGAAHNTAALAISDNGTTIVGEANSDPSSTGFTVPVRWTGAGYTTIQSLGALPGQTSARGQALDASPDGSIIVGSTRDPQNQDVAFLWTAADGMRALAEVLEEDYGLDLGGWKLHAANGISGADAAGEFTVVGAGTNPAGQAEGFVAVLSPTACNDGVDNDGDTLADYPADPECTFPGDRSELPDCGDGLDNDGDGETDFPADAECTSAADLSELANCSNGFDDDGDGLIDHPADPGCKAATSQSEQPACNDGVDNDGDTAIDGADSGCLALSDTSEGADCGDGIDNDRDGLFDFPADPDCTSPTDPSEDLACFDFVDNDGDGRTDYPAAFPRCRSASDASEAPECSDGTDDDGDGNADFPEDPQCPGPLFDVEAPAQVVAGDLLVVDRGQDTLFRIDPDTGAEQVLSQGALLEAPEGLARRADGRLVVSSPSGLFEVSPATGRQALRSSSGFTSAGGLPVAVDPAGHPVVLDAVGLHRVPWNPTGTGTTETLFTVPFGGNPGQLHIFLGYALVLDDADTAFVTGFGTLGDGVFRVDLAPPAVSKVTPGYLTHMWRDLARESPGSLVAVGDHFTLREGVYRIDIASGSVTAISTGAAWIRPESVAVGADGSLYVADSGTCDANGCTGGLVAHVNPGSGARTVVRSGIFSGTLQVAVAGAPPVACADGIDSDGDGLVDLADPGCANGADADERSAAACDNGLDDDGDGLVDVALDPGCKDATAASVENPACDNDQDDDGDGKIDWDGGAGGGTPDPTCAGQAWRTAEAESSGGGCGLGGELVVLLPLLFALRRRR